MDPVTIGTLSNHLDNYFAENSLNYTSPTTLWTAHKVVMCDNLDNLTTKRHKTKLADLRSLSKALDRLYNRYNQSFTPELLKQINSN